MEPSLFGYPAMVDPLRYMEMQAQYLRLLAQFLSEPEPSESVSASKPTLVSASVQVEMQAEVPVSTSEPVLLSSEPLIKTEKEPEVTFSPPIFESEEPVLIPRKKTKNFDDMPLPTARKGFQELLEEELSKNPQPTSSIDIRPHSFLKKGSKNTISTKVSHTKTEDSETPNQPKPPPKEFLKRRSGKLCTKKGQVSPPNRKDASKSPISSPNLKNRHINLGPDLVLGPPGVDFIDKLRKEIAKLQSEVEILRSDLGNDIEDALNTALEMAKNEKEELRHEFESAKRREMMNISREKKTNVKNGGEVESLKAEIRRLQEEAKGKEDSHRAACEAIRQQLEGIRKKQGQKGKSGPFKSGSGGVKVEISRAELSKVEMSPEMQKSGKMGSFSEEIKSEKGKKSQIPQQKAEVGEVKIQSQTMAPDGKIQRIYSDGKKEIVFPNGVRKEVMPDGATVVYFANKDVKSTYPDGKVIYHFAEAKTTQTTYADKLQVFQFANGQVEKHFPDGRKEIKFADGTVKSIMQDGQEESVFPDGTVQRIDGKGVKVVMSGEGQRDTLYPDGTKVREYPDGTIKRYGADGRLL